MDRKGILWARLSWNWVVRTLKKKSLSLSFLKFFFPVFSSLCWFLFFKASSKFITVFLRSIFFFEIKFKVGLENLCAFFCDKKNKFFSIKFIFSFLCEKISGKNKYLSKRNKKVKIFKSEMEKYGRLKNINPFYLFSILKFCQNK